MALILARIRIQGRGEGRNGSLPEVLDLVVGEMAEVVGEMAEALEREGGTRGPGFIKILSRNVI
jgi:hypothetical protein